MEELGVLVSLQEFQTWVSELSDVLVEEGGLTNSVDT